MSLSGDKGVAQFKKSVKMEHPNDNIKDMQVDGCQHGGLWGQQAREDQGIRWRQDVSLLLKFFI